MLPVSMTRFIALAWAIPLLFAVNLFGGPSMEPLRYSKWKQKILNRSKSESCRALWSIRPAEVGQLGTNRWAFKPELGYSERWGRWILDDYAGIWFFTDNPQAYSNPIPMPQTEAPVGSFEGHLSYDVKPRLWFSLDGNFWYGAAAGSRE